MSEAKRAAQPAGEWLSLVQAARQLQVHPTTLRRWADHGDITVMVTPGGHRRFAASELQRFAHERQQLRLARGLEQIWADKALSQTRQGITDQRAEPWLAAFDEEDRQRKRELGRRLMGIMLQYVALTEGGDELLLEAQRIGQVHAAQARGMGLPLVAALQAMLFFRDNMIEAALQMPETTRVRPEANLRLMRRINTLLNAVQLAIAAAYEPAPH
jgi:excisionase family DNA binding protein